MVKVIIFIAQRPLRRSLMRRWREKYGILIEFAQDCLGIVVAFIVRRTDTQPFPVIIVSQQQMIQSDMCKTDNADYDTLQKAERIIDANYRHILFKCGKTLRRWKVEESGSTALKSIIN